MTEQKPPDRAADSPALPEDNPSRRTEKKLARNVGGRLGGHVPVQGEQEGCTHLSNQLLLLLLTLLIPALQVPLKLGFHGLQVHLQSKLGILGGLKLVLQLLELGLHLFYLLLQGPLRLL